LKSGSSRSGYHCKLPDYHENHPKAALWIAAIVELPLADQQGRLGAARSRPTGPNSLLS
jgi:hypothetical protein